jgi:hypothetical protein
MPFKKGWKGGPGRPKRNNGVILYDIKMAAREFCPEALNRLVDHMRSKDERVSMAACIAIIERGFGKPDQRGDLAAAHKFVIECLPC